MVLSQFHQCPVFKTSTSASLHFTEFQSIWSNFKAVLSSCGAPAGGRLSNTRNGDLQYSTVQLQSLILKTKNPLCFVIGLPFTSYIESLLGTAEDSMQRRDSHWFLPIESPAKTSRLFRSFSNINFASNLFRLVTRK